MTNSSADSTVQLPDPASLKVELYPAAILKKQAKAVTEFTPELLAVIERMKTLMIESKGVGLAAPQVGIPLRFFVISPTAELQDAFAVVNPIFSNEKGEVPGEEGCLSLPDIRAKIIRYESLHLDAQNEKGERIAMDLDEWPARIVQHETDHLDGILILDRMSATARMSNRKKIREMEENAGIVSKKKK